MARLIVATFAYALTASVACAQPASWRDPSPHRAQMVTADEGVQLEVLDWGGSGWPLLLLAGSGVTAHIYGEPFRVSQQRSRRPARSPRVRRRRAVRRNVMGWITRAVTATLVALTFAFAAVELSGAWGMEANFDDGNLSDGGWASRSPARSRAVRSAGG